MDDQENRSLASVQFDKDFKSVGIEVHSKTIRGIPNKKISKEQITTSFVGVQLSAVIVGSSDCHRKINIVIVMISKELF